MPAAFPNLFKTKWDWRYETTAQPGLGGQRSYWPRMKATGGCSSMNAMIYIRGNRADFDGWQRDFGAVGWSYDDVLPYFVKAEGNTRLGGPFHGTDGPLHVEDRRYTHELVDAWIDSAVADGPARQRRLQRCRPGRRRALPGHLQEGPALVDPPTPTSSRPLDAAEPHRADRARSPRRVLLDGSRAVGVAYLAGGEEHQVFARTPRSSCPAVRSTPRSC